MEKLQIYNTLSRSKEEFKPLHEGFVGVYVCGPTVYGDAHLGHAKSYTAFDIIVKYLRFSGYKVRHVMNITDVGHLTDDADAGEDKLAKQARLEHLEPMEIAEKYTNSFFADMDALNVARPDITPRASGHIPEQIDMIELLIEKGHAYEVNGNVYFDVSSDEDYGKLSGRKFNEALSGVRVEAASDKKNPNDFALWKRADETHLMKWNSPWGVGYPGWHVECSAMSNKYLGETFDIHGGGLENQFPHHECEIAQSECSHGKEFVRYWLHNNMVTLNGQKMGKSLGNAISLGQFYTGNHKLLTRSWAPDVIRFFLLQSHYRSTTDFSEVALEASESGLKSLQEMIKVIVSAKNGNAEALKIDAFIAAFAKEMNDDFNTAKAIAVLFEYLRPLRVQISNNQIPSNIEEFAAKLFEISNGVLGIWTKQSHSDTSQKALDKVMDLVIQLRAEARTKKDWPTADAIRNQLKEAGIVIEDGATSSTYKLM
ncbi:MAG: cysteine--tRNA ligase [Bacteroidetes bacterium]|nr:cysteine--tRNA ligase [Bacteroidota bacterium]